MRLPISYRAQKKVLTMLIGKGQDGVRRITVETFDGWPIPNSIEPDSTPNLIALARRGHSLIIAGATELMPPTGRYNCHGLVFASRRTNIPPAGFRDPDVVDELLRRDKFRRVASPQVGDIVVYRYRGSGEIEHTGFVCRIEPMSGQDRTYTFTVIWSAWGGLGEFEHTVLNCPYQDGADIEYWRMAHDIDNSDN